MENKLDVRYERKFIINNETKRHIELELLLHPKSFKEIFSARVVNSIYLDNAELDFFYQNINGQSERKKYRFRWYGETFNKIMSLSFECKSKVGCLVNKTTHPLGNVSLFDNQKLKNNYGNIIHQVIKNEGVFDLKPMVLISYNRKYFLSHNKKIRATLDNDLKYYSISSLGQISHKFNAVKSMILEFKYNIDDQTYFEDVAKNLKYSITKNSKYVEAIRSNYPHIP